MVLGGHNVPGGSIPPYHPTPKQNNMYHIILFISVPAIVGALHLLRNL